MRPNGPLRYRRFGGALDAPVARRNAVPAQSATPRSRNPASSGRRRPRLVIRLLGEAAATLDGRPLPELTGPRMQRLLARVALAGAAGVSRDRLACELWPDSSGVQARTNLRKLLHDLRRALRLPCEVLAADPRTVRWCGGRPTWLDVLAFTDAAGGGDPEKSMHSY